MGHLIQAIVQSNLVNTTLVYTTPLILRHIYARPNLLVQKSPCMLYDYNTQ